MAKSDSDDSSLTPAEVEHLRDLADSDRPAAWVIERILDGLNGEG